MKKTENQKISDMVRFLITNGYRTSYPLKVGNNNFCCEHFVLQQKYFGYEITLTLFHSQYPFWQMDLGAVAYRSCDNGKSWMIEHLATYLFSENEHGLFYVK